MNGMLDSGPYGLPVPDAPVTDRTMTGRVATFRPVGNRETRRLNPREIRRALHRAPLLNCSSEMDVLLDESGSIRSVNDVIRLRRELLLIAIEHLASVQYSSRWSLRIS